MKRNRFWAVQRGLLVILTGVMLSSSCSTGLEVLVAGLDAAARELSGDRRDDITFGEWLADELDL